jgi:hypothetical protein
MKHKTPEESAVERNLGRRRRHPYVIVVAALAVTAVLVVAVAAWLGSRASIIKNELEASAQLVPVLKTDVAADNPLEAKATSDKLRSHTAAARDAAGDPLWTLAASVPWIGANFAAVTEMSRSADDVAVLGVAPLVDVYDSLDWNSLLPRASGSNLEPIQEAAPSVSAAARAVRSSAERLDSIDASKLWPQVSSPLTTAREQLHEVTGALDAAADSAQIAPGMLGAGGGRNYLLMIQNNAEARASGGIPGALAILTLNNGKLSLGAQSSASDVGAMTPPVAADPEQQKIYSTRLGMYMQDVNLTPDFPTAAASAQAMWEKKTGQRVDGVVSLDPVALGYILDATGPVQLKGPDILALAGTGLPTELTGKNVVPTLLSDVYAKIPLPKYQDAYFAEVAKEIFTSLSAGGKGDAKALVEGITQGAAERRILVWSAAEQEQSVLNKYPLSGAISGPSVAPAQFGVYFNDGTGAKMDYHVKRSVQLVKECPVGGYQQTKVRVNSTNTAPANAATSLPAYVTGGAGLGIPAGSVQTNVIAYGPVQADVETVTIDGAKSGFAAHLHANRPVGSVTVTLAPGQSSTAEFTFGRIVQHAEPNVVVTPTVQPVKDVVLPTEGARCEPSR